MRLYLAGADSGGEHAVLDGLRDLSFLVSYWYIVNGRGQRVVDYAVSNGIPLFLDSGAFSAMTIGAKIQIDDYVTYCKEHGYKFDVIASLDVIGNHRETAKNHDYMRTAGINSIPTFHVNAPFSELDRLIGENDYIALGVAGMQRRRSQLMAWLVKCFRVNDGRARFHGFALTSPVVMYSFPWFSVDSSTWINGRRFGVVVVKKANGFSSIGREDFQKYKIPVHLRIPRNASKEDSDPVIRHNAQQMLEWARNYK